jgi:predicted nucleic acid-binding Zn ribbon protein
VALRRRSPRTLETALAPLRASLGPTTLLAEVQERWPSVVGDVIAAEARPVSEHSGMLTVACSAAVWAQELELLSAEVLLRLNDGLSRGRITRLRCRADGR